MKVSLIRRLPLEFVKKCLSESKTLKDFCLKLGYKSISGDSNKAIRLFLVEHNLSYEHFCVKYKTKQRFCKDDVLKFGFIFGSNYSSSQLSLWAKKFNLLDSSICQICKMPPIWLSNSLTLQLDHIDGNNYNNVLDNLRFICPNCHSQTSTFCGRNFR